LFVFGSNTQVAGFSIPAIEGPGVIRLMIDPMTLMEGNFFLSLSIHSWDHTIQYHRREDWYPFVITHAVGALGLFHLNARWDIN